MKIIALVGMPGSGKSEAAGLFEQNGFIRIRFGDVTDIEIKKRGLPPGEDSERLVRESLRTEHGMSAYARLNVPRIDEALKQHPVVIDGLYSWEEYLFLKKHFGNEIAVLAVWSPPEVRYERLCRRQTRPLTREQAVSRDCAEVENSNKGGPIAMADYQIENIGGFTSFQDAVMNIIKQLKADNDASGC